MQNAINLLQTHQQAQREATAEAQKQIRDELEAKGDHQNLYFGQQQHPDNPSLIIVYADDKDGEPLARRYVAVSLVAKVIDPDAEFKK